MRKSVLYKVVENILKTEPGEDPAAFDEEAYEHELAKIEDYEDNKRKEKQDED